jgi:hypothetical protein
MGWEYHTYSITAASTTTRLRFESLTAGDTGPVIDDVSVSLAGDYERSSGSVEFAPGETTKTLGIPVLGDTAVEPDETFTVRLADPQNAALDRPHATVTILNDDQPAPRVIQVFVSSPQWPQALKDRLDADGLGSDRAGYAVPAGAGDGARLSQLAALPWHNVTQVSVRFDADVDVGQGQLVVLNGAGQAYDVTDFAYDPTSRTATWTVSAPFSDDRVELRLLSDEEGVRGAGPWGQPLDGEWDNDPAARPAPAYPSGDGVPGGQFNFRFTVLPGDVTGDGRVNSLDVADVRRRVGRFAADHVTGDNAYSVFADTNADGRINALDLAAVRRRLGRALPVIDPVPPTAPAAGSAPITREFFAQDEELL